LEVGISVAKAVKAITYIELDIFRATTEQVKNTFFNICICCEKSKRKQQLELAWQEKFNHLYTSKQLYQSNQIYIPPIDPLLITTLQSQSIYVCLGFLLSRKQDGKYSRRRLTEFRIMVKDNHIQLTAWSAETSHRILLLNEEIQTPDRFRTKDHSTYYFRGSSNNYIILFTEQNYSDTWKVILEKLNLISKRIHIIPIPPSAPPVKRKVYLLYTDPPEDGSCPINFCPTELLMIFFSQQNIRCATACRQVCKLWLMILDNKWLKKLIRENSPVQLKPEISPPPDQLDLAALIAELINRNPGRPRVEEEDDDLGWDDDWE